MKGVTNTKVSVLPNAVATWDAYLKGKPLGIGGLVAYYNFGRLHKSTRVTPAVEAGVTDHVWDLAELLV